MGMDWLFVAGQQKSLSRRESLKRGSVCGRIHGEMTEDALPYGSECVNTQPLKVVPFKPDRHKVWLPASFLKREDVSAEDKGLVAVLTAHLNKQLACWPTHPQLVKMCGFGHCKLEKRLNSLKKRGHIWWAHFTDEYGRRRCRYTILCLNPTPTNQVVATPSKAGGKHIAKYLKGKETVEEQSERYG